MQNAGSDYYQRAPRCCSGRGVANQDAMRSARGAELLCCCCSCSTAPSTKAPGVLASLGVCVLVLGYTLLGAFAFMALEGGLKSVSQSQPNICLQSIPKWISKKRFSKIDPIMQKNCFEIDQIRFFFYLLC